MKKLKGIAASPGIVIGKAMLLRDHHNYRVPRYKIDRKLIPNQIMRLEDALIRTRKQIVKIQNEFAREMGREHAEIFDAHLMVIEDRTVIEEVIRRLKKQSLNVEFIFSEVLKKYTKTFSKIGDEYLRERVADINDVARRVIRNLTGADSNRLDVIKEKSIVVAYDISPSDTASMHRQRVTGFVTDIGGRTSHSAILAKSLEIPAVVGLEKASQSMQDEDEIIVDGYKGYVIVKPTPRVKKRYLREQKRGHVASLSLQKLKNLPAITIDKQRLLLGANIELPEDITSVLSYGADGIGLFRTEYLYLNRRDMPSEEEQFDSYKQVVTHMAPKPVIIRTLDLGGDKFLSQLDMPKEMNPFLGWRAIRFCLAMPKVFKMQLRAILRASAYGKVKLMYPLISGNEEVTKANQLLKEAKQELRRRRIKFDPKLEVGAMIEIPSAALTCDLLAKHVTFFSIGTNDLIQYALAADRVNEKVAYLYEPAHPAVLRLIRDIIAAGRRSKIRVSICGEMAGDPELTILLVGLGLKELSASPALIPQIKQVIRSIRASDARRVTKHALTLATGKEIVDYTKSQMRKLLKDKKISPYFKT